MTKKEINEARANLIAETISTFEGRKRLLVAMWFPLERTLNPFENEQQRIDRHYAEIVAMYNQE